MNRAYFCFLTIFLLILGVVLLSSRMALAQNTNTNAEKPKSNEQNQNSNQSVGSGSGIGTGLGSGRVGNTGGGGSGGGGDNDYTRIFKSSEVTQKALITSKAQPEYTDEARKNGVEGVVRIQLVLSASGAVTNVRVIKSLPFGLTEKAIAAARRIQFVQAKKDGKDVSQYVTVEYNFAILYKDDDKDIETKAEITDKPEAEYTNEARDNKIEGKVILEVVLSPVTGIKVLEVKKGLPFGLTEKAIEATKMIKFNAAVHRSGRQVSQVATVEYVFKL